MCVIIDSENVIGAPSSNSVCVSLHSLSHREILWIQLFSHLSYGLNSIADWTLRSWLEASLRKRILWTQNQLSVNQTKKILATETTNLVKLWPYYLHGSLTALTSILQGKNAIKVPLKRHSPKSKQISEFWCVKGSPFLAWMRTFQHCLECVMYIYTHLQHTGVVILQHFYSKANFKQANYSP